MWDVQAEAERWRRQAANDLAFARVALRERFHAQACFIAQQAAEKAVKAIAYGLGERTVLGHSLVTLISRYADRRPELDSLRSLPVRRRLDLVQLRVVLPPPPSAPRGCPPPPRGRRRERQ